MAASYSPSTQLSSMENIYRHLTAQIIEAASSSETDRFLVIIAGAPGSGKTTLATEVARLLNQSDSGVGSNQASSPAKTVDAANFPQAVTVSMDGFHLSRSALNDLPNPSQAHARRGAPWTFDVKSVMTLTRRLKESADMGASARVAIPVPTFDHAIKDPVPNGAIILPGVRIVILEGNYLLLDDDVWRDVGRLVDLRIFIKVDPTEARKRVSMRHISSGIETSIADAQRRYDQNDRINGILIGLRMMSPDIIVNSIFDNTS